MKYASRSTRYSLSAILTLVWIMLILGLYYWVHKPLSVSLIKPVGGAAVDIAVGFLFASLAGGLGQRILKRVDLSTWTIVERLATHGLVGLCVLSLLVLVAGVFVLTTLSVAVLGLIVLLIVWRDVLAWLRDFWRVLHFPFPKQPWTRFLMSVALIMLVLALLLAVLPPTMWDVLTYHLAGPEQYVEQGRIYAVEHNHFLGFPQLVDTLYAGQLALTGRLTGSAVLHWVIGVFLLMMVGGYAARRANVAAGWLAVNSLLIGMTIWLEFTFSYADLLPIAVAAVALTLVDQWQHVRRSNVAQSEQPVNGPKSLRTGLEYVIVIGLLAGFGMSSKYTVLWLGVAFGILILWASWREGWRTALIFGVIYGLVASLTVMPWLIRNFVFFDNPVYPMVFESFEMDAIRQDWYSQPGSGLLYTADAWQIAVLPIVATFLGVEGQGTYGTDIGPLLLILSSLVLVIWGRFTQAERQTVRHALLIVGVITLIWALTAGLGSYISLRTRFVMYMFGPLAVVCGIAFEALRRLPKKPFDLAFVIQGLLALALIFMVINAIVFFNNSGIHFYFSGKSTFEQDYLEEALGWHYATMEDINALPAGTTVRFLWEPRYLYCDNERLNCYTDSLMDAWYYARRTVGDGSSDVIAAAWRKENLDYLLVYEFGRKFERNNADLYTDQDWVIWDTFVQDHLVEVWRNGNSEKKTQYILFQWRE